MEFRREEVDAFFRNGEPESWSSLEDQLRFEGGPHDRLQGIIELVGFAQSYDDLCWIGVHFLEPLIDLHWKEILPAFEEALEERKDLRRAFGCCWLWVPKDVEQRLRDHLRHDETVENG